MKDNYVPSNSNTDVNSVASHSCTEGNSIELDYPASARAIALWLKPFCNEELSYPNMIADAARLAAKTIMRLEERVIDLQMDCMTHEYNNAEAEKFWPQLKEQIEEPYKEALRNLLNASPDDNIKEYQAAWEAAFKLLNNEQEQERSVATKMPQGTEAGIKKDPSKPAAQPAITEQQDSLSIDDCKWLLFYGHNKEKTIDLGTEDTGQLDYAITQMFLMLKESTRFDVDRVERVFWQRIKALAQPTQPLPAQGAEPTSDGGAAAAPSSC